MSGVSASGRCSVLFMEISFAKAVVKGEQGGGFGHCDVGPLIGNREGCCLGETKVITEGVNCDLRYTSA